MKILCVEDGSVDVELIENGTILDGKVLIYKQGAQKPFILDIPDNYNNNNVIKELKELKIRLQAIINTFKQDKITLLEELPDIALLVTRIDNILKLIDKNCIKYINKRLEELKN